MICIQYTLFVPYWWMIGIINHKRFNRWISVVLYSLNNQNDEISVCDYFGICIFSHHVLCVNVFKLQPGGKSNLLTTLNQTSRTNSKFNLINFRLRCIIFILICWNITKIERTRNFRAMVPSPWTGAHPWAASNIVLGREHWSRVWKLLLDSTRFWYDMIWCYIIDF